MKSKLVITRDEKDLSVTILTDHVRDHSFFSDHPEEWKKLEDLIRGSVNLALLKHEMKLYG